MHRNTQEKNQERIDLIMDTALRLYREKSAASVSVLDICQACKITKPTFYKYVGSKEMILAKYFQGTAKDAMEEMETLDDGDHLSRILYGVTYGLRKAEKNDADLLKSYINYCLKEHKSSGFCGELWKTNVLYELEEARKTNQIQTTAESELIYKALGALALGLAVENACENTLEHDDIYNTYIRNASSILLPPGA